MAVRADRPRARAAPAGAGPHRPGLDDPLRAGAGLLVAQLTRPRPPAPREHAGQDPESERHRDDQDERRVPGSEDPVDLDPAEVQYREEHREPPRPDGHAEPGLLAA